MKKNKQLNQVEKVIDDFNSQYLSLIEQGALNPLDVKILIKRLSKSLDEIEEQVCKMALAEAEKYGSKTFQYKSAEIEICELGTKYDYTNCNSHKWNKMNTAIKDLTNSKTELEKLLKTIKDPIADPETGELIYPAIKTSTTGLKIKFLKNDH